MVELDAPTDKWKKVHSKLFDIQKQGKSIKCWWFNTRAGDPVKKKYTNEVSPLKLLHKYS